METTTQKECKLTKRDYISMMAFLKARIAQLYKQLANPSNDLDKMREITDELIQYTIKRNVLDSQGKELGY